MKKQVSEYIAEFLVKKGVTHNYTVPGGGAMYLNMAFGHQEGLENVFVQHEQAAAMAAEAHARIAGSPQLVCCTTGPGGTNTLTGVLGAWLDSIPMIVVSGQVKYDYTKMAYEGLGIRALGDQEFNIVPAARTMTKYAVTVEDPATIRYHLERAWDEATSGRPGPVWLDVPQNVQRAMVEEDSLVGYEPQRIASAIMERGGSEDVARRVIDIIRASKRPVLNVGNGVRIADAYEPLQKLVSLLRIPVVTGVNSIDCVPGDNPYYVGRAGGIGDRPGNWAVQNSDVFLSIGSRLSVRQVGYDIRTWARDAFTIVEDVDAEELRKPTVRIDMPIHADAKDFINALCGAIGDSPLGEKTEWIDRCLGWRKSYPVVHDKYDIDPDGANLYFFMGKLSVALAPDTAIVTGNGSACVASSQVLQMKSGQRYIFNSGAASMGYDLPAAIGAAFASPGKEVICLSGDGSIQMNLQELQTIVFHRLPIKIFVINNGGYHSMRQTEGNLFPDVSPVGIGPETGDLSFPSMEKISWAYGIPYVSARSNDEVAAAIEKTLSVDGPTLCEVFVTTDQKFEPKSATKKLEDGTLVSPPLEDLAPFLPREELEEIMVIPLWEEQGR